MILLRLKTFSGFDQKYKRTHTEFGDYNHSMIIGKSGREDYRGILANPGDKKLQEKIKKYEALDGSYPLYYRDIKNRVAAADYYDGLISEKEYKKARVINQEEHAKKKKEKDRLIFE